MRRGLPNNHGLEHLVINAPELLPSEAGSPVLTDIQYEALEAGIARGASVLISAPTSTGKTLIGWWTIASAIKEQCRTVYLVSHRALAKQKFEEAQRLFLESKLDGDRSAIVCATGDSVEDASGRKTSSPLSATILVATYEKFLGCLSTGGPPLDLTDTTFICDEIQLIGDKTRGQSVEILITLLKRSGWRQFVGLSAVLSETDAEILADWLNVDLVRNSKREKTLSIECRSPGYALSVKSSPDYDVSWDERRDKNINCSSVNEIINDLCANEHCRPVIVFCMKVDETFELANSMAAVRVPKFEFSIPSGIEIDPGLVELLRRGVAFHNAELSEEERLFVEERLQNGKIDVVFSTTTLAAGVNFPLGSAVFASWQRWNFNRKRHEPIGRAEFQNMAGRVGRMGQHAAEGRVIMTASNAAELTSATQLMDLSSHDGLGNGIAPEDFGALTLQLFAGKLCASRENAFALVASTLSAAKELHRNVSGVEHWRTELYLQIDRLVQNGCLIESGSRIGVTVLGQAVARSGLKPETALYFIDGLVRNGPELLKLLPNEEGGDDENDLVFVLSHAALSSPEFNYDGGKPTRHLNWRISRQLVGNPTARRLENLLFSRPWVADVGAANGAMLLAAWASGEARSKIEKIVTSVRLGTVQGLSRDVSWILIGISEIVSAVTAPTLADETKPASLRGSDEAVVAVRTLARAMRRQAARINSGLTSDVLWMLALDLQGQPRRLARNQILALRENGLVRPLDLMSGDEETDVARRAALGAVANPRLANMVRDAAKRWKIEDREYCRRMHAKRAGRVGGVAVIDALYSKKGDAFEDAFAAALDFVSINYNKLDERGRPGYPDFSVNIEQYPSIVFELKTKNSETDVVPLNAATEVLTASELIGMRDHFCVTVCSPGFEPTVPGIIERCGRLCVVDACDFAEAILRVREGRLTRDELYNWLTTPGVALREDLPYPR